MKTKLIEFSNAPKSKKYTKCELGKIVGSIDCISCVNFVSKICDNEKINGAYTLVQTGIVECKKL